MLNGIPKIFSPELLKVLMEMGHGDEIVIADGNFPSTSIGQRVIRLDGHDVPEILEAILRFFPLDTAVESPVILMDNDSEIKPEIWSTYQTLVNPYETSITTIERFAFYDRAKAAFAVIATSESALYANVILKKGCVI